MMHWENIRKFGMDTLDWWELVVKPGVRQLGMLRGKVMKKDRRSMLNLLLVRQAHINKKIKLGQHEFLGELKTIHSMIQIWYETECNKVKDQSRAAEFQQSEKVTIYHHKIHKKKIRKSAILKLETTQGIIEGHTLCAEYLENDIKNLLLNDAGLDPVAQVALLEEVSPCFTEENNILLCALPTLEDVKDAVNFFQLACCSRDRWLT